MIWRKLSGVLTAGAMLMLPMLAGGAQADSTTPALPGVQGAIH